MSAEANARMYFGSYGGRFVPEMLLPALEELERTYRACTSDRTFQKELDDLLKNYCGRPTPLYYAENLTKHCRGAKIYLKLEGLAHTGAHKINNAVGQALLARRMGKKRLIAETGAGQHGLATATVAARFGLECKVFMGEVDMQRQQPNVFFMKLLGSEVAPVPYGSRTLKDAVNAALKYWIENLSDTYYLLGSALGPHPYPLIVRDFQSVIGREAREQIMEAEGRLPDTLVACVGGGSNSLGLFHAFLPQKEVAMIGVEAGGRGSGPGDNAVRFGNAGGRVGVAQGYRSYFIQDENGQLLPTHSISAGLDYAGVGPELAHLHDTGRITFTAVSDDEALAAVQALSRREGIIPAMESAHAVAHVLKLAPTLPKDHILIINISGRGDKDLFISARALDRRNWLDFLAAEANRAE